MLNSTLILSFLLLIAHTTTGYVLPKSKPCTQEEMMKPLNDIYRYVEEMQASDADVKSLKKKISQECQDIPMYIDAITGICGEEKTESMEKLNKFFSKIQTLDDIINAIDSGHKEKAKELLEDIHCEHILQIFVRHYGTDVEKIKKLIDIISMMDDMKLINMMNEAIIYILDESNISISKKLLSLMKDAIIVNKDKVEPELILAAKLNFKEVAKKNLPNCFCGVKALLAIDSEMANKAVYEAAFQITSDSYFSPSFKMVIKAPSIHMKVIVLEAIFDKMVALELQSSMVAARTLALAKHFIEDEQIKTNEKSLEILNNIINNSSIFARNMETGYICQNDEEMRAIVTGEEIKREVHNEYIVFYNSEEPEKLSNGKFVEKLDGDSILYVVDRKYNGKITKYSILVDKADYPENVHLEGDIVSRKMIGKEPATREEICGMNPKPEENICVTLSLNELLIWHLEEAPQNRAALYENFLEHSKFCNRT